MGGFVGKDREAVASSSGMEAESDDGAPTATVLRRDIAALKKTSLWDPNLPQDAIRSIDAAYDGDLEKKAAVEHALLEEDSPYPEVRAAVRNYDEDVPANTPRAWIIGMLWCTIGSAVNMLFSLRNPSIYLTPVVTLLLSYPFGLAWQYAMPSRKFKTFGYTWSLNGGPFNMKEHTLIVIMANASFGGSTAYSTDVLLAQEVYYGQKFGWAYQLLLTITCQMLGLGLAGLTRKWLVEPAAMIWPSNLIITTMFETIHTRKTPDALGSHSRGIWKMGRYRWFLIAMGGIFVWEWFPLWIAPFLGAFTFVCWAAPNNVVVNQLFGGQTGLALLPITFDWSIITAFVLSPLFDPQRYSEYSPLFLSTTFALAYGLSFATIIAVVVHTGLFNGQEIWAKWKAARGEGADIHQRMMMKYREAPSWWYASSFVVMFALGLVTCLVWETHLTWWAFIVALLISLFFYLPIGIIQASTNVQIGLNTHLTWWAFIVALLISLFFYLPIGIIQASTNVQIGLNVLTEFIIGYMQPGRPLAMMMFKMYGYITCYQGLYFTQDIKLAHYMKVPQRTTFWAQFIATLWSCIVQIAVYNWALGSIDGVCEPHQANNYTCPNAGVFFTASIIWGAIGPQRIFGTDGVYHPLSYFFLLGLGAPIVLYLLARRFPTSNLRYVNTPIIFGGTAYIPPATPMTYATWGITGFLFNKVIKDRHRAWWTEYNFITSAALDSGTIICILLIFFALQLPNKVSSPEWWGGWGGGFQNNGDWNAVVQKVANGTFGPRSWK
ncbi:hypothetical protein BUE80_DR012250 [Diplocarpon rosae]|nr:hypothetical protein BUE80_DR012250 [Diplocarpon rosae]